MYYLASLKKVVARCPHFKLIVTSMTVRLRAHIIRKYSKWPRRNAAGSCSSYITIHKDSIPYARIYSILFTRRHKILAKDFLFFFSPPPPHTRINLSSENAASHYRHLHKPLYLPGKKKIPNVSDSYGGERVQDSSNWVRSKPKVLAVPVFPGTFGPVWLESVGVSTGGGEYGLSRKRGGREEDLAATESCKRTRTSVCLDLLGGGISRGPFILDFEEVSVKPLSEYGTVQDGDAVVSGRLAVGDDPSRYGSSSLRPIGARKRTRQDMDAALRVPKKRSRTSFTPSITASAATDSRSMSSGVSCVSAAQLYSASDTTMMSQYLGDSGAVVAGGGPSALPVASPSVFSTAVTMVPGDVCVQELLEAPYGPVRVETLSTLQPPTLGRRARPSTHRRTRSGKL